MSLDLFIECLLVAALGTAAITVSTETESTLSERESSNAPGRAVSRIFQLLGAKPLEAKSLAVASTWGHWLYGIAWGVVLWLLVDPAAAGLELWLAGLIFFFIVLAAAQIVTPALAGAKPSIAMGVKPLMVEGFHHAVYAVVAALSLWLMWRSAGSLPPA